MVKVLKLLCRLQDTCDLCIQVGGKNVLIFTQSGKGTVNIPILTLGYYRTLKGLDRSKWRHVIN